MFPGAPRPCGHGHAWANTMVMGERRSRKKNTVAQKDMSTHLSIFQILQTIDFYRLEGLLNVPRPEAFAATATLRTILYLQVMFFAAKKSTLFILNPSLPEILKII